MQRFENIKRVINGVAYNTATSTCEAIVEIANTQRDNHSNFVITTQALYVTRNQDFFLVTWQETHDRLTNTVNCASNITPYTSESARKWIEQYAPESPARLRWMGKKSTAPESAAAMSIRLSGALKESITLRAAINKQSVNQVAVESLEYVVSNNVLKAKPPVMFYRESDAPESAPLLTEQGMPGYNGIRNEGEGLVGARCSLASGFRDYSRHLPEAFRLLLVAVLEGSIVPSDIPEEERAKYQAILRADAVRWLRLHDRAVDQFVKNAALDSTLFSSLFLDHGA